jgi:uncharacterized membrane protein HdeD (DUF308 family)
VSIVVGIVTFSRPGLTTLVLLYIISFWATMTGILEIIAAIRLRKEIQGEWMLALSGVISILFGMLLLFFPAAGAVTIAWMIGWYAILFGAMFLSLGLRLRNLSTQHEKTVLAT